MPLVFASSILITFLQEFNRFKLKVFWAIKIFFLHYFNYSLGVHNIGPFGAFKLLTVRVSPAKVVLR